MSGSDGDNLEDKAGNAETGGNPETAGKGSTTKFDVTRNPYMEGLSPQELERIQDRIRQKTGQNITFESRYDGKSLTNHVLAPARIIGTYGDVAYAMQIPDSSSPYVIFMRTEGGSDVAARTDEEMVTAVSRSLPLLEGIVKEVIEGEKFQIGEERLVPLGSPEERYVFLSGLAKGVLRMTGLEYLGPKETQSPVIETILGYGNDHQLDTSSLAKMYEKLMLPAEGIMLQQA